jgi:DNA-binding NarL/FixJ family response regulator
MADAGSVDLRSVAPSVLAPILRPSELGAPELTAQLSRQDVELLRLLARGLPLDAVARRLNTSERTVRRRIKAICDRLGVGASIQAVVCAARAGLV